MEIPLIWEQDSQQIIKEMSSASELEIEGLKPHERKVKMEHTPVSMVPSPK